LQARFSGVVTPFSEGARFEKLSLTRRSACLRAQFEGVACELNSFLEVTFLPCALPESERSPALDEVRDIAVVRLQAFIQAARFRGAPPAVEELRVVERKDGKELFANGIFSERTPSSQTLLRFVERSARPEPDRLTVHSECKLVSVTLDVTKQHLRPLEQFSASRIA
jgi:hypothetical protein